MQQLLHEPELRAIFADAVVGPRLRITESILQAGAANGEIDAATLTPYTARVGTALVNQQMLLTGARRTSVSSRRSSTPCCRAGLKRSLTAERLTTPDGPPARSPRRRRSLPEVDAPPDLPAMG